MDRLKTRREIIRNAAVLAGKFIKAADPTAGLVYKEGRGNFFTAADIACEKIVVDLIQKHFPSDTILSEETESTITDILAVDALWIIDPIDGTNNFTHKRNYSCISIGYAEKGIVKLGAIYNPYVDELFFAEKGNGAWVNSEKLSIGRETDIEQACIATDNSYDPRIIRHHLELLLMIPNIPFVMLKGSAALALAEVAAGRMDLYFHSYIHPWDDAAALLMLQEAGGVVRNFNGQSVSFNSEEVVAGNSNLVDAFVKTIKQQTPLQ